jgi:hypothetical protein
MVLEILSDLIAAQQTALDALRGGPEKYINRIHQLTQASPRYRTVDSR